MIPRQAAPALLALARQYPVVTLTGPRQSGKTTLCRAAFPEKPYANLERPDTRQFAREDPLAFLRQFPAGAVLDEIQRAPDLVSYIQDRVDAESKAGQFILTGSQQFEVTRSISQSLAGRTALLRLLPLTLAEIHCFGQEPTTDRLLYAGGYPRIHDCGLSPTQALGDYFETYVQRDLRDLITIRDLHAFEKFVRLCAGRVGQLLNLQSLASEVGISGPTAKAWLSLLEASYIVILLQPHHANLGKRLIKAPKLYFTDVGLASFLIGITREQDLPSHPLRGSLFENLIVGEALKARWSRGLRANLNFYRDSSGHEVDLLLERGGKLDALEIKSGETLVRDAYRGLERFSAQFGPRVGRCALVYGGASGQRRSWGEVLPKEAVGEWVLADGEG